MRLAQRPEHDECGLIAATFDNATSPLEKLAALRTPEGLSLPPNMMKEVLRDMDRLALVSQQFAAIEQARIGAKPGKRDARPAAPRIPIDRTRSFSLGGNKTLAVRSGLSRPVSRATCRDGST
ncbi:MAG: hypothetical protein ACRC67_39615 [Inquilinus sp.]|uniref:hypothetical protein n=1 Tax=Inquilinus sp. TaxID=1932117 RepID=UPI003F2B9310